MNLQELHQLLRQEFGADISDLPQVAAGDASITVSAPRLHDICTFLKNDSRTKFDFLRLITGADRTPLLSSVYHLYSYELGHSLVLRVDVERNTPHVPSVCDLWPTADWLEREAYDMIGIIYDGHPDLRRILLPLDWEGYPLRKDYEQPKEYHGIEHN